MAKVSHDKVSEQKELVEMGAQDAPVKDIHWKANQIETTSETKLEDDDGHGGAAIIRMFEFGMNPEAFARHQPTKQELFNSHLKGIEMMLWKDGMKVMPEVEPRLIVDEKKKTYRIFVGAKPQRGHILREQPQTLKNLLTSST